MDTGAIIVLTIFGMMILLVPLFIWAGKSTQTKKEQITNMQEASRTIECGMYKDQVLTMLGTNYTKSILKSGEEKYVWKIEGSSYSYSVKGTGIRSYSHTPTRRISVYFKNNRVTRFDGFNLD